MGTYYKVVNVTRNEAFDGGDVGRLIGMGEDGGFKADASLMLCGPPLVVLMMGAWSKNQVLLASDADEGGWWDVARREKWGAPLELSHAVECSGMRVWKPGSNPERLKALHALLTELITLEGGY